MGSLVNADMNKCDSFGIIKFVISEPVFSRWLMHDVTRSCGERSIPSTRWINRLKFNKVRKVHWYGFIFHITTKL